MLPTSHHFAIFHCKITSKNYRKTSNYNGSGTPPLLQSLVLVAPACSDLTLALPLRPVSGPERLKSSGSLFKDRGWIARGVENNALGLAQHYLIGSKNLLTLTFIKSMLNKRKQVQRFLSPPDPLSFCWTRPFDGDLLPVSCSTFSRCSRSVLGIGVGKSLRSNRQITLHGNVDTQVFRNLPNSLI